MTNKSPAIRSLLVVGTIGVLLGAAAPRASERPSTSPTSRPSTKPTTRAAAATTRPAAGRRLGIRVVDLAKDGPAQIPSFGGNLIVNEVSPGSRAERLGLRMGDAIKWINGKEMTTAEDVVDAVQRSEKLKIEVIRNNAPRTFDEHETPEPEEPRGL
jgi:S1-C subfamily serine protease